MLGYLRLVQKYALVQPRTYWCEFQFFTMISGFRQKFCLGSRPGDLAHVDTIEQKAWEKHQAYLNRLERLPLEKAEYYVRLKEAHGVNTVRGLSKITGENWSYIAKILRTLELPEPVKDFLQSNRTEPALVRFFHLRRLRDIVRQGAYSLDLKSQNLSGSSQLNLQLCLFSLIFHSLLTLLLSPVFLWNSLSGC
jgi:hypothetical protein